MLALQSVHFIHEILIVHVLFTISCRQTTAFVVFVSIRRLLLAARSDVRSMICGPAATQAYMNNVRRSGFGRGCSGPREKSPSGVYLMKFDDTSLKLFSVIIHVRWQHQKGVKEHFHFKCTEIK